MDALVIAHESTRQTNHPENHPHDQSDEGVGDEGEIVQESSGQCSRYGRRFQVANVCSYVYRKRMIKKGRFGAVFLVGGKFLWSSYKYKQEV